MDTRRTVQFVGAAVAVAGVGLSPLSGWGHPAWWALPVFAAGLAVVQAASVRIFIGRQAFSFSLNDVLVALALVFAPGAWIAVAYTAGMVLWWYGRRLSVAKVVYNAEQAVFSLAAASAITLAAGGGVRGALIGSAVFAISSHMLIAVPIALTSGARYSRVLLDTGALGLIHTAGNVSVGLLAAWLVTNAPVGLLGLVVPLGLLWWSYRQQTRRAAEARLYAELAQGQEKIAGGTIDASAQVVVTAAARLFGGAEVEMLLRHPDGPVRYLGDEHGLSARLRAESDAFDAPWVLRALAERGVRTGNDGDRPYCSAILGDPARPLAVLIARRPARAAPFNRGDAQLAEVLVGQAEAWLSVADLTARHEEAVGRAEVYGAASRVLGDLGQETVPALAVLRESANRLSRLASAFNGPAAVDEIVTELHSVERAVASLLGAIALASDPMAADGSELPVLTANGVRGETEWTTTGRIEDAVRL
jgi:hypothetical protein